MPLDLVHSPKPPLLNVQGLEVRFGDVTAVQGLDLTINHAETVALVGESGCGKSAMALSVLRLLPPAGRITAGTISFEGQDVLRLSPTAIRRLRGGAISMIFQEPMTSLNPVLKIGPQITEALRQHEALSARAARRRAIELLDLVRIPNPAHRVDDFPHSLSGGMRQRVMIAIAVACRPKLLIADEPTTALDVTIQAQVLELLDRLRCELAMGLLLITHDLGIVADWADRAVVMYAGRKCEEATVQRLFRAPLHPYTRGLIGCSPRLEDNLHFRDGRLPEIPGSIASASGVSGCPFAPRCASSRTACWDQRPEPLPVDGAGHLLACPVHAPVAAENVLALD